jgi:hypothetical protein
LSITQLAEVKNEINSLYLKLEAAHIALSNQKTIANQQAVAMFDAAIDVLIDKQLELEKEAARKNKD